MEWYWWLGIAAVVALVGVVRARGGIWASVRAGGRSYLSDELKKMGIRERIPDGCVAEIADVTTDFYIEYAKRKGVSGFLAKGEMIPNLERDARVIQEWTRGRDIAGERIAYIPDILRKYEVPLGSAKAP